MVHNLWQRIATCQKVIIMTTWNVEATTICTVSLLCNLEIPSWTISIKCFRHKPLRNFTVICQLDRKYYIPQGLTFCKAVKAYRIRFLRNALFQIDFTLLFEYDFNSIVTPKSVFILKLMLKIISIKFRYSWSLKHGTKDMMNAIISIFFELRNTKQPVSFVPGILKYMIISELVWDTKHDNTICMCKADIVYH